MNPTTVPAIAAELADREAIRHCLAIYCRGVDQRDTDLVRLAYWPDATDDHAIMPPMTGAEFVAMMERSEGRPAESGMELTRHSLNNILIDLAGDNAKVETYLTTYHRLRRGDGQAYDVIVGARFLDRMEKRNDEWRVAHRIVTFDWVREFDDSADLSKGFLGAQFVPGGHKPEDASYKFFQQD